MGNVGQREIRTLKRVFAFLPLHTHEPRKADLDAGKTGKQVRSVSAKRADMLQLPLDAWPR